MLVLGLEGLGQNLWPWPWSCDCLALALSNMALALALVAVLGLGLGFKDNICGLGLVGEKVQSN